MAGQKHLKDSEIQLRHTTQPQLWLEIAILGLLTICTQSAVTPAHNPPLPIARQIASIPPSQPEQIAVAVPPPAAAVAPKVAIEITDLSSTWEQVLQQLLPASRDLFTPFGKLISISEAQAIVAMKSSTMQTIASSKVPELAKVFSHMLGRSIAVKLEVLGKSQPQPSYSLPSPPAPVVTPPAPPPLPESIEYLPEELNDDVQDSVAESPLLWSIESPPNPQPIPAQSIPAPSAPADLFELEPPLDFAEPPESLDVERAIHTPLVELEELEIDPLLQMATDNVVKVFNGKIIDRSNDLFDRIVVRSGAANDEKF